MSKHRHEKPIEPITLEKHYIVGVEDTIPTEEIGQFYDKHYPVINELIEKAGVPAEAARAYYLAKPGKTTNLIAGRVVGAHESEAVLKAAKDAGNDTVKVYEFPAADAVKMHVQGSYDQLPEAWDELMEYANHEDLEIGDTVFEEYANLPGTVAEDDLSTDIVVSITGKHKRHRDHQ